MKDSQKAMLKTFAVGFVAAYAFSVFAVRFGPIPGIAKKGA